MNSKDTQSLTWAKLAVDESKSGSNDLNKVNLCTIFSNSEESVLVVFPILFLLLTKKNGMSFLPKRLPLNCVISNCQSEVVVNPSICIRNKEKCNIIHNEVESIISLFSAHSISKRHISRNDNLQRDISYPFSQTTAFSAPEIYLYTPFKSRFKIIEQMVVTTIGGFSTQHPTTEKSLAKRSGEGRTYGEHFCD
jgi:hypothetical protein